MEIEEIKEKISWKKILLFFPFWLSKFLNKKFDVDLTGIGVTLTFIYLFSMIGSYADGNISSFLIRINYKLRKAGTFVILIMIILVLPVFFDSILKKILVTIFLIASGNYAHQGYVANIYTIVFDIFPKTVVSTVVELSGFTIPDGRFIFSGIIKFIHKLFGCYCIIFIIAIYIGLSSKSIY